MPAKRVLFFGTHPKQFNGYSKVVYEIAKSICDSPDIKLSIYGFQNFHENQKHRTDLSKDIIIYDAFANEQPKGIGFGVNQVKEFVKLNRPDVCIVYNDMLVIQQIISQLKSIENQTFKIIAYIDQVYLNQKKEFIDFVNKNVDAAIMFTKGWEECIKKQGLSVPAYYLEHGFNPMTYFPIPKNLARQYFGVKPEDFVILNLNRNQPRKRWDICLKAFAEVVSRRPDEPIKMLIATAVTGAWNLVDIFERELKKRGLTIEVGMKHIIFLDNPQKITDEETNLLYNVADIGINTCDGEGFGLCNFEQAGLGIPQVVPRLGGFVDFFDDDTAMLMDPKMAYYVDSTRDMVCGEALLCDYMDFVDAIEAYYTSKELRERHGQAARKNILTNYSWKRITEKLVTIVKEVAGDDVKEDADADVSVAVSASASAIVPDIVKGVKGDVEPLSSEDIEKLFGDTDVKKESVKIDDVKVEPIVEVKEDTKPKKKKGSTRQEMLKLKKQLEALLSSYDEDEEEDKDA